MLASIGPDRGKGFCVRTKQLFCYFVAVYLVLSFAYFVFYVDLSLLHSRFLRTQSKHSDAYAAICLVVKDDHDVVEWLTYHNRIGVGKFYIFDNGSDPPLKKVTTVSYQCLLTLPVTSRRNYNLTSILDLSPTNTPLALTVCSLSS